MKSTRDELLELVDAGQDPCDVCRILNVPKYVAFMWLRRENKSNSEDLARIASGNQKLGILGETHFKELVPEAINANANHASHPDYDFEYRGLTIDVKTASKSGRRSSNGSWTFSAIDLSCDLFVLFMTEKSDDGKVHFLSCILLPSGYLAANTLVVYETTYKKRFGDMLVDDDSLKDALDLLAAGAV